MSKPLKNLSKNIILDLQVQSFNYVSVIRFIDIRRTNEVSYNFANLVKKVNSRLRMDPVYNYDTLDLDEITHSEI